MEQKMKSLRGVTRFKFFADHCNELTIIKRLVIWTFIILINKANKDGKEKQAEDKRLILCLGNTVDFVRYYPQISH